MAKISNFLVELGKGPTKSRIRKKWDDGDTEGAMQDFNDAAGTPKLSETQKQHIRDADSSGDLRQIQQDCQAEQADNKTHVFLWVK